MIINIAHGFFRGRGLMLFGIKNCIFVSRGSISVPKIFSLIMVKRIILISLVTLAVAALAGGYLLLQRSLITGTDPFDAVAGDAVVVVRTKSIYRFFSAVKSGQEMWSDLEKVLDVGGMLKGVDFLDSLLKENQTASELAEGKSLFFSVHPAGRDRYETVYYLEFASTREGRMFNDLMNGLLSGGSPVSERAYNRARIYDATFRMGGRVYDVSWTVNGGVFILSYSALLVENAVDQLDKGGGLHEDESFKKVLATSGENVDANVFFNLQDFPHYISAFSRGQSKNLLSGFSGLGDWAELDLHLRDDAMMLNGFSLSKASENNYLNVFSGQSPVTIGAESVIPGYSSGFLALGLSDLSLFYNNHLQWLEGIDRTDEYKKMREEFMALTGSVPDEDFHSFMEGEVALVMSGWENPDEKGELFLLIKTRSRSLALKTMLDMLRHNARLSGASIDSYREVYRVDRETSMDIYSFPFSRTGELLFGKIFGAANTSWFTFVENYLVFGESVQGLSEFIHANVLNQTLSADTRFREFSEYLVARNNFWFYSNLARSAGLFTTLAGGQLSENITGNPESFRKFQALSLQFGSGRDMLYNNFYLKYSPQVFEEPQTDWQTLLDTVIDFKPLLLINHNTGENEIFVQDLNNTIYLINNAGRILWKKPLPGRIMGSVYQIDYYRNNRLQMLFNTREQIYLLDRNGNDVGRYPIRLPSPATNGISVFDYENNKDYRIFVACEDKSVVVRSREGNIISGWTFPGTEHNVYHKIQHFRTGGRDYIVFADRHRVYILDRRGNTRTRPDRVFPVSTRNNIVYEGRTPATDPRLVITDTLGSVWHIYLNGNTELRKLGDYSANHYFDFQDVNADGYRDYIFVDSNRLEVYGRDGTPMFSREFTAPVDHAPAYYHFSRQDRKIGVVSQGAGQIFLVNSGGEIYQGFPLHGRSYFTIGFLYSGRGNFQLIVGSDDNFLYNYVVY